MKDKIIEILQSETWNVTNEAGDLCTVVEEEDFDDIAERIVKIFAIPDVSQQSELLLAYDTWIKEVGHKYKTLSPNQIIGIFLKSQ